LLRNPNKVPFFGVIVALKRHASTVLLALLRATSGPRAAHLYKKRKGGSPGLSVVRRESRGFPRDMLPSTSWLRAFCAGGIAAGKLRGD